nr:MAG TPA: protein of unknown function DUF3846 [Caudoviricetes sp.]
MSKILILTPEQNFKEVEIKGRTVPYEVLRDSVGGLIELYNFSYELEKRGIDCFVDEEYLLKGNGRNPDKYTFVEISNNEKILNIVLGNMVFCKTNFEGESLPLNNEDIEYIKKILSLKMPL